MDKESLASTVLAGIRVLDLTRVRAGPTAVRQLADWGADVIKLELPASLEADGALGASRETPDFQNLHRNKRSLTLNLKNDEGRALFMKLVKKSDVVVENYRPDVKKRLGIDYESLKISNPGIILASISGFGQDGPYSERPGFDQIAQGMGGLMSITGEPGRGPMRVGIPIADLTAGLFCAQGILLALMERQHSGEGQWLHTSLLQAQVFMLDFQAARWLCAGEVPGQAGNNHPTSIPTGVFKTADGAINLAVAGETIWVRFAETLGKPEWLENPKFIDSPSRSKNRDLLNQEIEKVTLQKTSREWVELFEKREVPCGPIYQINEVFEDPQVQHLGIAQQAESLTFGKTRLVGQPLNLTRTPSRITRHPPGRGEHTSEILSELGLNKSEIQDLQSRNVI
ncbi:MAG: CaiB/BaiF CoA-transferase family protein [SAR324 cluster bacterium]|jgi:formyl-CoA transferase|nr:CaiB/BaiF CoA-transferase family protein [SAR324 cluster bacterium]MEE1575348.1 CaiB/BaiF CoA-transferase family protein [Deltaproteobacteria bacterium]MDP6248641.1 CaiB/BaiF CoA-transferase family protein [SAR324 cluster bacterium]MDP6462373.1 CaiB/BaiF CoA-transferase family protein [SAR324 cluster bacterium]MDP6639118.1 CaiB/BaiF CoA-transferase family protein [SAR324 cluster bacterium]|tara:strand:+ start:7969 stop:9165 length:1197 start_codon:yes stop_codon:yes gene_type:complete